MRYIKGERGFIMLKLYQNIRELRKQNNWSQEELARRMGYTDRSSIAKIEGGKVDLSQSKILEFAHVFGVDAGELMGNDGIDTPEAKKVRDAYINDTLSSDDRELLDLYHIASAEARATVDFVLKRSKQNP